MLAVGKHLCEGLTISRPPKEVKVAKAGGRARQWSFRLNPEGRLMQPLIP